MIDLANLPNDVDALKAIIVADRSCIARLEVLVAAFKQAMFGRKSEKLVNPSQKGGQQTGAKGGQFFCS